MTTSITGGEEVANNFDDEWTTGNWCYVLPVTPCCTSGVAAAAAAAAATLINSTSISTEDNDDGDTRIRHPPVDEISSGNTTEATNDDADDSAAWKAGNWCWQQREEEKEEYCVRSGDRSCTKHKRTNQEQNISTCDSMKVETNDDDGVGDEDTMNGDGRGATIAAAAVMHGTSISTEDDDKLQHPPVVKNDATTKTAIWNPSIPTPQNIIRPIVIPSCCNNTDDTMRLGKPGIGVGNRRWRRRKRRNRAYDPSKIRAGRSADATAKEKSVPHVVIELN